MKTKYKYIHFVEALENNWSIWNNRTDDFLGMVDYNKNWKQWELFLEDNVGFTKGCLLDVIDFINQLSESS